MYFVVLKFFSLVLIPTCFIGASIDSKQYPDILIAVLCLVAPTLCNAMDCSLPGSSDHGDSPGKNTGMGSYALLQGIFPTQGSNPGLPHCRQILYWLSHQGSLRILGVGSLSLGEGNGTLLQFSCLESPMDGGAWWAAVHGVAKSRTQLSNFPFIFHFHALEKEIATHSSQCSCLENPRDGGAWWAAIYGVTQSQTRLKWLSSSSSSLSLLQGIHLTQGSNHGDPGSPALQVDSLPAELPGKPDTLVKSW